MQLIYIYKFIYIYMYRYDDRITCILYMYILFIKACTQSETDDFEWSISSW